MKKTGAELMISYLTNPYSYQYKYCNLKTRSLKDVGMLIHVGIVLEMFLFISKTHCWLGK